MHKKKKACRYGRDIRVISPVALHAFLETWHILAAQTTRTTTEHTAQVQHSEGAVVLQTHGKGFTAIITDRVAWLE